MASPLACLQKMTKIHEIPAKYMALAVVFLSALALAGAFTGQYLFDLRPCELCIIQRIPFAVTILLGVAAYFWADKQKPLLALSGVTLLVNAGIAFFHSGVERKWWAGLTGCTTPEMSGSIEDIMQRIQQTAVTRCDEIPWSLFGLSMANFNVLYCLGLGGIVLYYVCTSLRRS